MPHIPRTGKLNESQAAILDSVESERPPTHALVGSSVGHLPCPKTHYCTFILFLIDKKVLRGAEDLVDSLVAVFADVGDTFKRSKDFSDHIFYWLRLSGNKVAVKDKNITVTVRNDFRRLETFLHSFFGNADESGGESFPSVGKGRVAIAGCGFKNQFVFHVDTLAVRDGLGKDFLRFFDTIFVELVQLAPVGLVVHQLVDAAMSVAKRDLEGHDVVDVNFNFHFHAKSMGEKPPVVKGLFFGFAENRVLTSLTHSADSELLFGESVLESVGATTAGDARATCDGERASASEVGEGDVVELVDHVLCFHRGKVIRKIAPGQGIFSKNFVKKSENTS